MKHKLVIASMFFCTAAAIGSAQAPEPAPKPDNTKVNKRDRNQGAVTADQQKMNKADRELTQKIRKSIMADKTLSTNARNIKVISRDGMVTLKGPVDSANEKTALMQKAVAVAGSPDKVTDEISIKN